MRNTSRARGVGVHHNTRSHDMAARHTPHTMDHELLEAVSTGDADLLAQILGVWSTGTAVEGCHGSFLRGVTAEGSSALHIAASRGYLELVVMICTHDSSLIKARNNYLDTPLICAARAGHAAVVLYLVKRALAKQEADLTVLRAWNSAGATAMHEAIRNGHGSVFQTLMLRDSRLATMVEGKGLSPLYLAIVSNRADMVEVLVAESCDGERSPACYAGPNGQTALHAAVYASKAREICESLLHWEPTLGKKIDNYGRTALHYAALAGKIGVVKLLLGNRSLAYIPDNDGLFPVHAAALTGKINVIREFMKICPSVDELLDKKHRNILHCAIEHGRLMIVWYICRNRHLARMLNAVDSEGNTPLHLAVKHGHIRIFSLLMMDIRVNLGIINHDGLTTLEVAYRETYHNYSFSALTSGYITRCLQLCEAYPSDCENLIDTIRLEHKESSIYKDVSKSILYISVLIATGSFAAAFTPPGGYKAEGADAGLPVLGNNAALIEFVVTNSISFFCSTFATCLLVHASLTNIGRRTRRRYLSSSVVLVSVAVLSMILTFVKVASLTLDPDKYLEDYIFFVIFGLVGVLVLFGAIFPSSILLASMCLRVSWQLPTSNRKLQDILKVLVSSIIPLMLLVGIFVITGQILVELLSDIEGDAKYLQPT